MGIREEYQQHELQIVTLAVKFGVSETTLETAISRAIRQSKGWTCGDVINWMAKYGSSTAVMTLAEREQIYLNSCKKADLLKTCKEGDEEND